MAENTNEFAITRKEQEQEPPQTNGESKTSADMWQKFLDNTTLHGIRYVFTKRHVLIRLLWLVFLLTSGGYYIFTVYKAFDKYYSRPITVVLSRKHKKQMDFPAVTICPQNIFSKRKILMTDNDPLFSSGGLNISSCAVTSVARGNQPCGLSLICCCTHFSNIAVLPNCTTQYQQDLSAIMRKSGHGIDLEELYRTYSPDISSLIASCSFGRNHNRCSAKDFVPMVTSLGICYTFNSGTDDKVKTVDTAAVGLSVVLDAQTHDHSIGSLSTEFEVIVHGRGEHVDGWGGAFVLVGPGQHASIVLSQKKHENLEKPYSTNCSKKSLKTVPTYTLEGCLYECVAESTVMTCKCRIPGYKGHLEIPACTSQEDEYCFSQLRESLDYEACDCPAPCVETKYHTEVSYSKFPKTTGFANKLTSAGFNNNVQYQRENLVLLDIGFKSLSYELQKQQPAYDSNSLFGEIGGNMGLFLGCSLLTICEFFDFLFSFLAARRRQITHPA